MSGEYILPFELQGSDVSDALLELVSKYGTGGLFEVKPRRIVDVDGGKYEYRYSYGSVAVDEMDDFMEINGRTYAKKGDYLLTEYGYEEPLLIDSESVYMRPGGDRHEAERQAYYALSILASKGLVSRWMKND